VIAPHARGLLARPAADGRTVVPMLDRTRAAGGRRVVAVAARAGGRALPPARRVGATGGAIGLPERREAVEAAARPPPDGTRPVLTGGRFHGSPESIGRCRRQGWRPRLKQGPLVFEAGGGTGPKACSARGERLPSGVELTGRRAATDVATVHEPGHPEPRIIAVPEPPTVRRALDHGLGWGIEAVSSDFETRGFGPEDSRLRRPERPDRLILVTALALSWAVSTGMGDAGHDATPDGESPGTSAPRSLPRPDLPLQARHPPPPGLPATPRPATAVVDHVAEFMGGEAA